MVSDEDFTERLLSQTPVTIRRRVIWGDCDPAGIVYTPRFADYVASSVIWFMRLIVRPLISNDIGMPMKAMAFEFHKALAPDDFFNMIVTIGEIRSRTFDVQIDARGIDGEPRFESRMTPIFIERSTFKAVPISSACIARLVDYRDAYKSRKEG
jgi:acyl-CoA thioesterase FadM